MPNTFTVITLDPGGNPLPGRKLSLVQPPVQQNPPVFFTTDEAGQDTKVTPNPGPSGRLAVGTTPADAVPLINWTVTVNGSFALGGQGARVEPCPTLGEVVVTYRIPPAPTVPLGAEVS